MGMTSFSLTVSEGKRLLAKGVAALPCVRKAMETGLIAVCKGTTNAYVAEELLGRLIEKTDYVLGATLPSGGPSRDEVMSGDLPDIVLRDGRPAADVETCVASFDLMGAGDVIIKGGNALSYDRKQAAVLVGHPEGGTAGAFIGRAYGRKINVVIPMGLEKQVAGDLREVEAELLSAEDVSGPSLWVFQGEIVTEIEAIKLLTGAEAVPVGAGGVGGAEGAVWLAVKGTEEQLEAVAELISEVQGEPPFIG